MPFPFVERKWLFWKNVFSLHTYRYPAISKKPHGVVVFLHGLNQHSNHFAHIAKEFSKSNFDTVAFDFMGYGKSEGKRGFIKKPGILAKQALKFMSLLEEYYGLEHKISLGPLDLPVFVAG
jgi:alpha-beta hydrolase superfamily lysophospholipase